MPSHENAPPRSRAPSASRARKASSSRTWRSADAHAAGSWVSSRSPLSSSATTVVRPPTAAAITGVPVACASAATSPNDSLYDGTATTDAAAYQSASSAGRHRRHEPHHVVDAEAAARSARASGCSSPVPDGPPTIGTTRRDRRSGVWSSRQGDGAQQDVGRLERLQPTGEEHDVSVGR